MNKSLSAHTRLLPALTLVLAFAAGSAAAATTVASTGTQAGAQTTANEASAQPVGDSWITTKVKADLLATEATKGLDINVTTTNGVVTLSGKLDSKAEVDRAVALARGIKGVKSVDATTLTVKPRS
jgi:hyperosmotically inducible periplasmic protein